MNKAFAVQLFDTGTTSVQYSWYRVGEAEGLPSPSIIGVYSTLLGISRFLP